MVVRLLVTGAAGYLGSRLCATLKGQHGVSIRALVRTDTPWAAADELVTADLLTADLGPVVDGIDAVVHLAGANEVAAQADPDGAVTTTVSAARRLASALPAATRVVYVSTVHVYGAAMAGGATVRETTVASPRHPYAIARLAAEHTLAAAGVDLVVLRLTNSVGAPVDPRVARWTLVANDLCRQAATDGRLVLRTHGMQWRDFIHQADACDVITAALDPAAVPAGTWNLGSGTPMTVRDLADLVADAFGRLTGTRPPLDAPAPPDPPPPPVTVDVSRLTSLGLAARRSVSDAVDETARFCLDHRGELRG